MRGELDGPALQERIGTIRAAHEETADRDEYVDAFLVRLDSWIHAAITETRWECLRRDLAFLKSDLERKRVELPNRDEADRPRQIRLARWHAAGLAAAIGLSVLFGWWVFAVACVASFLLYQIAMWRQDAVHRAADQAELRRLAAIYPFASEEEWLARQVVLEEYRIPAYRESTHGRRPAPGVLVSMVAGTGFLVSVAAFGVVFAFMFVTSLFMWPLWLLGMSLCGREMAAAPSRDPDPRGSPS
jgi:hypothetical protein